MAHCCASTALVILLATSTALCAQTFDKDHVARSVADQTRTAFATASKAGEVWAAWNKAKEKKDPVAVRQIFDFAEKGNNIAQNLAGYMLDHGEGVTRDSATALRWFEAAAPTLPIAAYNAGVLLSEGRGTSKNERRAAQFYTIAAEKGKIEQAAVRLMFYHYREQNFSEAWKWADLAVILNNRLGYFMTGKMLLDGTGPRRSPKEAHTWLSKAADLYSGEAADLLSWLYQSGEIGDKNISLSLAWKLIGNAIKGTGMAGIDTASKDVKPDDVVKAQKFASQWLASHKRQPKMDYTSTLIQGTNKMSLDWSGPAK